MQPIGADKHIRAKPLDGQHADRREPVAPREGTVANSSDAVGHTVMLHLRRNDDIAMIRVVFLVTAAHSGLAAIFLVIDAVNLKVIGWLRFRPAIIGRINLVIHAEVIPVFITGRTQQVHLIIAFVIAVIAPVDMILAVFAAIQDKGMAAVTRITAEGDGVTGQQLAV